MNKLTIPCKIDNIPGSITIIKKEDGTLSYGGAHTFSLERYPEKTEQLLQRISSEDKTFILNISEAHFFGIDVAISSEAMLSRLGQHKSSSEGPAKSYSDRKEESLPEAKEEKASISEIHPETEEEEIAKKIENLFLSTKSPSDYPNIEENRDALLDRSTKRKVLSVLKSLNKYGSGQISEMEFILLRTTRLLNPDPAVKKVPYSHPTVFIREIISFPNGRRYKIIISRVTKSGAEKYVPIKKSHFEPLTEYARKRIEDLPVTDKKEGVFGITIKGGNALSPAFYKIEWKLLKKIGR